MAGSGGAGGAIAAEIVSAAMPAIANVTNGVLGYFSSKKDRAQALQIYEDAKNYNSPVQQVARMQQAGLNPYGGQIVGDQIADSIDLGQNPMQSFGDMVIGLGRTAQQAFQNRLSRINADTAMYNAESSRMNAQANKSNAEVNRDLSQIRKELFTAQKDNLVEDLGFKKQTHDFRVSEANLKYQITKYIRDKYKREGDWMSENYEDLQDAILEGIRGKNRANDYMINTYYPKTLDIKKDYLDIDYQKFLHELQKTDFSNVTGLVNLFIQILRAL